MKLIIGLSILAGLLIASTAARPALAQPMTQNSGNLLVNGGFESPYYEDFRGDGGGFIATGWAAWYFNDAGEEYDGPKYMTATKEQDQYRIHEGVAAQQYYTEWIRHIGGVYQRVDVPRNSRVRFTIYGQAWSSFCKTRGDGSLDCDPRNSAYGGLNPVAMKVGIDPTGGSDPFSSSIIWSTISGAYDNYQLFSVEAAASGGTVTVYVYSEPQYPTPVINIYWDSASLTVVDGVSGSPTTSQPTTVPTSSGSATTVVPPVISPQSPNSSGVAPQPLGSDGSLWHTVRSGETLGGIARAYGVPTQTLRDLNQLTSDFLSVGQELLIRAADPSAVAEATPTPDTATPTPQVVADVLVGRICLSLFEDANENGLREEDEGVLVGGRVTLSGTASASYVTEAEGDPYCFIDLVPGDYEVAAEAPQGYHLTGLPRLPVTLSGSGDLSLAIGAAVDQPTENLSAQPEPATSGASRTLILALSVGGGLLVLVGIGFGLMTLMNRRTQGNTKPSADE